jgi:hypothetical protein
MIVTHAQAKELGYCNAGLRKWFAGRDLTFDEFRRNGASAEWLLAQNDAMAARLVEHAAAQQSSLEH